jgi:hypothetical protein
VTEEERTIAYVLDVCQRSRRGFTLREIIAHVRDERPEVILEFASIWAELLRHKRIRVFQNGEPCTYEVLGGPKD